MLDNYHSLRVSDIDELHQGKEGSNAFVHVERFNGPLDRLGKSDYASPIDVSMVRHPSESLSQDINR